jgi:hypothetical protein
MGTEEWEEVQAKGMENVFNKIIVEKFPNYLDHSGTKGF